MDIKIVSYRHITIETNIYISQQYIVEVKNKYNSLTIKTMEKYRDEHRR